MKSELDSWLNSCVTKAIFDAEHADPNLPGTRESWWNVMLLELGLAVLHGPETLEGDVARRGSVLAAESGGAVYCAINLCHRYIREYSGIGADTEFFREALRELCLVTGPQAILDERIRNGNLIWTAKPTIVCLCGSTRFHDAFLRANYEETLAGRIVLSVAFYPDAVDGVHGETVGCNLQQKSMLDDLHLRRIDLCDEILVLNVNGYIGESTARERDYAVSVGKRVRYLETSGIEACFTDALFPDLAFGKDKP